MALSRREALVLGGVAVAAAAAGFVGGPILLERTAGGAAALREASFADLSGRPRRLSEWQGRVLVLNFWATWCAPCREEIPLLMATREKYSPNGLEIVGIAIDLAAKVGEYARSMGISYPILVAGAGGLDLMRKLGNAAGGLPYTVFVDRRGGIAQRKLGALRRPELEAAVSKIIS